jgi:glycerophosphoryl diester phosphodiesterase
MRFLSFLSCFFILLFSTGVAAQNGPHPNAHAHNDYEHKNPLQDALDNGFTSVEADVHLIKGELYVAHIKPWFTRKSKTLKALYLEPLLKRAQENNGRIYPNSEGEFLLMIDIKGKGEEVYQVLKKQLEEYRSILTSYENRKQQKAVTIFLSGYRPIAMVKADNNRLVAIDGRPSDIGKGITPELMPVISDNYKNHLKWRGKDAIPEAEWTYLRKLVEDVHKEGKRLRLWASPDHPVAWETLYKAGVDLINTDDLEGLNQFLSKQKKD